jgi:Fic family protein
MSGVDRAGYNVKQPGGFSAYIPRPLPPAPELDLGQLIGALSTADQALGRLDGATRLLPDADLFLAMYVRREALLSSQIEGTDCTLDDVLAFELDKASADVPEVDVLEVVNYVAALNYGIAQLSSLPISGRLLRGVHQHLLREGRGSEKSPGEFRRTQNWIGPAGCSLEKATFVPPPVEQMLLAISDLEKFIDASKERPDGLPLLIVCGLVHAQFETIHPFLDGNGRIGRLLITLLLCERGALEAPVLYLSTYLRRHRSRYFDQLADVRFDGDWESWLEFFLLGVAEIANDAAETAQQLHSMREDHRHRLEKVGGRANDFALLDCLYTQPLVNAKWVGRAINVSPATANNVLTRFEQSQILREITGQARNRVFRYDEYLSLFDQRGGDDLSDETVA